ncbi:hypothetical protein MKZ38_007863 [Zalerion maritima]|uniref:Uncharacterized protein n=1 Tax=Zalerion maritima TaxID=339359 RepID=A0AAD5RVQ1_9PEZI|nr:hypothetical protein MKZ38_007863 [Zalerion maritima]
MWVVGQGAAGDGVGDGGRGVQGPAKKFWQNSLVGGELELKAPPATDIVEPHVAHIASYVFGSIEKVCENMDMLKLKPANPNSMPDPSEFFFTESQISAKST